MNKRLLGPPDPDGSFYDDNERYRLEPNVIFVFGSNLKGIHGAGAAKSAMDEFSAIWGQAEGLQGQAYALPTCSVPGRGLHLGEIKMYVERFNQIVDTHPELHFFVTAIACGYAGYSAKDIAPMFRGIQRCWFPWSWRQHFGGT
jgi:hypothetical protein